MVKIITIFLLSCFLSFAATPALSEDLPATDLPQVQAQQPAVAAAEREMLVDWVSDNAQTTLSREQSEKIVDAATVQATLRNLDTRLVLALIRVESGFRAVAHGKGSKGLMQVQVHWHKDKLQGRSPYDPLVSIEVGTQILSDCWNRSNGNLHGTLRCYNGGGDKKYYSKVTSQMRTIEGYARLTLLDQFLMKIHLDAPVAASND